MEHTVKAYDLLPCHLRHSANSGYSGSAAIAKRCRPLVPIGGDTRHVVNASLDGLEMAITPSLRRL